MLPFVRAMDGEMREWCRRNLPDLNLEEQLGAGGMGVVLLGTQRSLERKVAVKLLPAGPVSPEELARFRREARTYAALSHPNLVKVFDADLAGEVAYIVLEYLDGTDLRGFLHEGARLDPCALGRDIAGALAYIHDRGILHRDIKPANILVCANGRPVLLDFGLAKATSADTTQLTADGDVVGTPAYVAPELLFGKPASAAADVYALGLVLYEVIARRSVFVSGGSGVAMRDRVEGRIPTFGQIGVRVDPRLEALMKRCLALDVGARPTAAELGAELAALAPPSTPAAPAMRAPRSIASASVPGITRGGRRWLAPAAAALLVLIAAGIVSRPDRRASVAPVPSVAASTPPTIAASILPPTLPERIEATDGSTMVLVSGGLLRRAPPGHVVEVKAFYVDRCEITNAQYAVFEKATGRPGRARYPAVSADLERPQHPVVGVSFEDANAYCAWAGKTLPDEDQWEMAARGRSVRTFPWGDEVGGRPPANFRDRSYALAARSKKRDLISGAATRDDDGFPFSSPVGSFPAGASPCGALDMVGNVAEWCRATPAAGPPAPEEAVVRGGSWRDNIGTGGLIEGDVRCAGREPRRRAERVPTVGFRGVRAIGAAGSPRRGN